MSPFFGHLFLKKNVLTSQLSFNLTNLEAYSYKNLLLKRLKFLKFFTNLRLLSKNGKDFHRSRKASKEGG